MKTAENAVQTQGRISSFINSIWKPENRFAILLVVLMAGLLIREIYDKFQRPVNMDYVFLGIIMAVVLIAILITIMADTNISPATMITIMVATATSNTITIAIATTVAKTTGIIQIIWSMIIFVILFFLTEKLWVNGRRYFPAYILFLMSILVAIQG